MTFPNLSIYHRIQHSGGGGGGSGSSAFSFTFDSTWSFLPSFPRSFLPSFPRSFVRSAAASSQFAPEQYYLFSLAFAAFSEARTPRVLQPPPSLLPSFLPSFRFLRILCFLSEPRPGQAMVHHRKLRGLLGSGRIFDPRHLTCFATGNPNLIPISGQCGHGRTQTLATGSVASRRGRAR